MEYQIIEDEGRTEYLTELDLSDVVEGDRVIVKFEQPNYDMMLEA